MIFFLRGGKYRSAGVNRFNLFASWAKRYPHDDKIQYNLTARSQFTNLPFPNIYYNIYLP
jgi:hypothetical protein